MFDPKPSKAHCPAPAPLKGWLQLLPERLHPHARLMRLDRPIGWWLLLLPCWWSVLLAGPGLLSHDFYGWYLLALFFVGAIAMRSAGCIINDFWDKDYDGQVVRTAGRPLVTGEVSKLGAVLALVVSLFIGLLVFVQLTRVAMILAALSCVLAVIYPLFKRITWWPQAILGLTFNIGALVGWASVTGQVDLPAAILYAAGICWTIGYDTVYAYQDREDDAQLGLRSTALLFGKWGKPIVALFYAATCILLAYALWLVTPETSTSPYTVLPIAAMFIIQLWRWNPDSGLSCWEAFRSNRDIGLLIALACAVSYAPFFG